MVDLCVDQKVPVGSEGQPKIVCKTRQIYLTSLGTSNIIPNEKELEYSRIRSTVNFESS